MATPKIFRPVFLVLLTLLALQTKVSLAQVYCTPNDVSFWGTIKVDNQAEPVKKWEQIALTFIDKPYVAHTLEVTADTSLVINLLNVDCTTYVEYVLATFFAYQKIENPSFEDFKDVLEFIRYRDGKRDGYPSRLHYYSEWLDNNQKKGLIKRVESQFFKPKSINLDFMSTHRESYEHLADDANFEAIKQTEKSFKPTLFVLPKATISEAESVLKHGDLIALVATIKGIDVTHTGFIYKKNGVSHLLHASSKSNKVEISEKSLKDYIKNTKSVEGILVYRFLND
ncbi:DUF1460 domain-containing protein [bacterium]|nr:MAG: DUF1460 domain-containing protein [bacterium]